MSEAWDLLAFLAGKARGILVNAKFASSLIYNGIFIVIMEAVTARNWRRYWTRGFLTDLCYLLFFAAGLYYFFVSGPVGRALTALVQSVAPWYLQLNLLGYLHPLAHTAILILVIDGVEYAMHRLGHSNRLYWKFHCIHHSAEHLTPLTKFRVHFIDMTVFGTVKFFPAVALGLPPDLWMPILPLGFLQILSHCDLDWGYGWVGKLVVSPRFHRIHHSADPAQCHKNFGIIFSLWDYVFGTAAADLTRPLAYGVPGVKVPDSFPQQFFYPFFLVAEELGLLRRPAPAAKPQPS